MPVHVALTDAAVVVGGRNGVVVEGFDVGASPREFAAGPARSKG